MCSLRSMESDRGNREREKDRAAVAVAIGLSLQLTASLLAVTQVDNYRDAAPVSAKIVSAVAVLGASGVLTLVRAAVMWLGGTKGSDA